MLNVAPLQAKLKKLKGGQDRAEREMSKYDVELEQAVPADMTIFEENIEVRHFVDLIGEPAMIQIFT
jgi:hypothetical protein